MPRPTIEQARATYPHRFTMEHIPAWALKARPDRKYCAPQYRTDAEWYAHTVFPGEKDHPEYPRRAQHCYSTGQTWPVGHSLNEPFKAHRRT